MKQELSILIPVYNSICVETVRMLSRQCQDIQHLNSTFTYEIIVADDASTDAACIAANQAINQIEHCRFVQKEQNTGSAATRNYLAKLSQYQWLLFLDSDMQIVSDQMIYTYINNTYKADVVNGGIRIGACIEGEHNLRYKYEKACEPQHTASQRSNNPYQSFRSTNFLIKWEVMQTCPFDERFKKSGYEDVLFGKQLKKNNIRVCHIDNPTEMTDFENNVDYMEKTDRSLRTLYQFREDLRGYSHLLTFVNGIHLGLVEAALRTWHRLFGKLERRSLCGRHPNLTVFKLYKLGYYLTLTQKD